MFHNFKMEVKPEAVKAEATAEGDSGNGVGGDAGPSAPPPPPPSLLDTSNNERRAADARRDAAVADLGAAARAALALARGVVAARPLLRTLSTNARAISEFRTSGPPPVRWVVAEASVWGCAP